MNQCVECPFASHLRWRNEFSYDSLWCEKLGARPSWYGITDCEEGDLKRFFPRPKASKPKSFTNRYEKDAAWKEHLKRLYEQTKSRYPSPVYLKGYWENFFEGTDEPEYLKRFYVSRLGAGKLKRLSNRKVRRDKSFATNGGKYKRLYDYWNELI